MESAAEENYFTDLVKDHAAAEESLGQFLDRDPRDDSRLFVHIPSCNAAAGFNCSFALLNGSEISALTEMLHNGMTAVLPESTQHKVTILTHETNGIISVFFGAFTGRNSAAANYPKPKSGILIMTTGDA